MSHLILTQFHNSFCQYITASNKGKAVYLYANDEKNGLEVSCRKKTVLQDVFLKTQSYLLKKIQPAHTASDIKIQIEDLNYLLKDGQKLIDHYYKRNHTWCRRLLKLIHAYAPKILKNYFPKFFTNSAQAKAQKTQAAYQIYSNSIKCFQKKLEEALKKIKIDIPVKNDLPKKLEKALEKIKIDIPVKKASLQCLSDTILGKILKERLSTKERSIALSVCHNWNEQLIKATAQDMRVTKTYVESIIKSLGDEERFKPIIAKLNAILSDKKITRAALTDLERKEKIQEMIYTLCINYKELLNNNIEIVKIAVAQNGYAIKIASYALRNNVEIAKIAVAQNGDVLWLVPIELQGNAEIVKIAVAQNGEAIKFASPELQGNAEIVKIAVAQDGAALQFARDELKRNTEIVKIAVAQNGRALRFASTELQGNAEIVKIAVTQDGSALQFASAELQGNAEIVKIAKK